MEHATPIIVAIIGGIVSILSVYIGYRLKKTAKSISPYDGDEIRIDIMELAVEVILSPLNYCFRASLIVLPIIIVFGFFIAPIYDRSIESWLFLVLCGGLVTGPIYLFITINVLAKNLKSLGMSKKEILTLQKVYANHKGIIRFVSMHVVTKLLR